MPASIVASVVRGGVVEATGAGVGSRVVGGTVVVATRAVVRGISVVVVDDVDAVDELGEEELGGLVDEAVDGG